MQEVRLQFQKVGRAVYLSHLDVVRCLSRALSRAELSVRYTQGFNPQPYLVFSPPLSLGYAGLAELCDFSIDDDTLSVASVASRLDSSLPHGLVPVRSAVPVFKMGLLYKADYQLFLELTSGQDATLAAGSVADCLKRDEITVLKKSKRHQIQTNIAPLIEQLRIEPQQETVVLSCRLSAVGESALNPRYLVEVIRRDVPELPIADISVVRLGFALESGEVFQ